MFENSPLLDLTLGRSSVRQRILAVLMDDTVVRLHLREIQRRAATSPGTASRELARLVAAGLILREAEGSQVYFRVSDSPFAAMLRSLLIAMPAPEFKPEPPRVPTVKPAPPAAEAQGRPADVEITGTVPDQGEEVVAPESRAAVDQAAVAPPVAEVRPASLAVDLAEPARRSTDAPRLIQPRPDLPKMPAPDGTTSPAASPSSSLGTVAREPRPAPDRLGMEVAGRLVEMIRPAYGVVLRGVYLYGARAAGPAPADADVETIIVLERVEQYGAELERTSHVCAALSRELNLVVSRIFVSESDWNGGTSGTPPAVRSEAVAI